MGMHRSTKTYGHNLGLSCAFRQWRASSHCHFVHGYAIQVSFEFSAEELDYRNWVVDFGGMKPMKKWLEETFDHKTLVAEDDPEIDWFEMAHRRGMIDMVKVPAVGCEKFAEMIFKKCEEFLRLASYSPRVRLESVEVREHGANSGLYTRN